MEYLLKVSMVVTIFYFSYKLFLQRDTFFEQNRWFFLLGIVTAFLIPLFVIKEYIEYAPIKLDDYATAEVITSNTDTYFDFSGYLSIIYVLGVLFFMLRFVVQITSLLFLIFNNNHEKQGMFTYIKTRTNVSPFSFFNWIVYNPNQFNKTELEQILTHEKIHAKQYHSIDVLLSQITCILLWFNPFIWLYNKDLKQNLEFLADHAAINFSSCKKTYQYTLLKTSLPTNQLALSNHFYNSLIKKRIVMLHKSKSKKINQFKFTFILPLLVLFLMSFNVKKIYIEKETPSIETVDVNPVLNPIQTTSSNNSINFNAIGSKETTPLIHTESKKTAAKKDNNYKDVIMVMITKKSTDAELENIVSQLKDKGVTIKFKGVKRNGIGEITAIKIDASSKNSNANFNLNSDDAIKPVKITYNSENDNLSIGNVASNKSVSYVYANSDGKHKVKTLKKDSNIMVFSNNDDTDGEVEVIVDSDSDINVESDEDIFVVRSKEKGENIFFTDDENDKVIKITVDDDNVDGDKNIRFTNKKNNKHFISTDGDEDPLYVIDGKEVDKSKIKNIDKNTIKSINVLKGDSAIEKYGDKAKDGVVEITTKE